MTDTPRIPLPRNKPGAGKVHFAFKCRNARGASITSWGEISEVAARRVLSIIGNDKDHPGVSKDNVVMFDNKGLCRDQHDLPSVQSELPPGP